MHMSVFLILRAALHVSPVMYVDVLLYIHSSVDFFMCMRSSSKGDLYVMAGRTLKLVMHTHVWNSCLLVCYASSFLCFFFFYYPVGNGHVILNFKGC